MSLAGALLLMASVWVVLLLGAASRAWLGHDAAILAAHLLATALAAATGVPRLRARNAAAQVAGGVVIGFASSPGCLIVVGALLTLAGCCPPLGLRAPGAAAWLAAIVLAPLYEEVVYRERLLVALRQRVGSLPAVVASSLLFALPHVQPHAILAAALVGLALGAVRIVSGSVMPCVGVHAGLNLGAWVGVAPGAQGVA